MTDTAHLTRALANLAGRRRVLAGALAAERDRCAAQSDPQMAELWNALAILARDQAEAEAEALTALEDDLNPFTVLRPLTAEELAEVEWPDTPSEPPC